MKIEVILVFLLQCFCSVYASFPNTYPKVNLDRDLRSTSNIFDSYHHLTDLEDYPEVCDKYDSENCANLWLKEMNKVLIRNYNRLLNVQFNFSSNINEETLKVKQKFDSILSELDLKFKIKLKKFQWKSFNSSQLRKLFGRLSISLTSNNISILNELLNIETQISTIYSSGKPCFTKCLQSGEPDIVQLFKNETDYDILKGFWVAWRNVTGARIRNLFINRVKFDKIGALENGYNDIPSVTLFEDFEDKDFKENIMKLYYEILPFYKELHAFVRHCLANYYPGQFDRNGPIPAHILGNVWGQQWNNIFPIIRKCYGKKSIFDYQKETDIALKGVTVNKMFQMAEEFYESIGMPKMTDEFWERSKFIKLMNKTEDCHAATYDFSNGKDFRMSMCTKRDFNDFIIIHHEMGHIQYYMAYKNLSVFYRFSANSGFHEAIGDTIGLAVRTPDHLIKIGLISQFPRTEDFEIDYLMATALEKVVFLPFAITMDSFIWNVYNGSVPMSTLNKYWWDLRFKFQGLKPPVERSEKDFDPGAKYHISFGISYIRYFVSFLIQFQFYEAMCNISGHVGPLHHCDFYQSKKAGFQMFEMLKQGRVQHWKKTIKILTGQDSIKSESILKYFKPLHTWLINTNKKLNISVGW